MNGISHTGHMWRRMFFTSASLALLLTICARAQLLDKLDDNLFFRSSNGFFRTDLSVVTDLETYTMDGPAPGLIFDDDRFLFHPRLSLFLDSHLGKHFYSSVQARFDRGIDPGLAPDGEARVDEYLVRWTPLAEPTINLQVGKFATVVGNWVPRHDTWNNPFITGPLPYDHFTTVSDFGIADSLRTFVARRDRQDQKGTWLPIVWGASYASGGAIFGRVERFDYAFEMKNASISSRPFIWEATDRGWEDPTFSMRLGYRPNATWNVGASASSGAYLKEEAAENPFFPAGDSAGDYRQITVASDISYAWRGLQIWGEAFASRFEIPNVGDLETISWYVETKYKLTPHFFVAGRINHQFFDRVIVDGRGERWDRETWRADVALGYRFNRHWQAKAQFSHYWQTGPSVLAQNVLATQLTLKF